MVTGETKLPCTQTLNEKLLKKVFIGIFALKVIQNCKTDFKIHSDIKYTIYSKIREKNRI